MKEEEEEDEDDGFFFLSVCHLIKYSVSFRPLRQMYKLDKKKTTKKNEELAQSIDFEGVTTMRVCRTEELSDAEEEKDSNTGRGEPPPLFKASLSESSPVCVTSADWTVKPVELQWEAPARS